MSPEFTPDEWAARVQLAAAYSMSTARVELVKLDLNGRLIATGAEPPWP